MKGGIDAMREGSAGNECEENTERTASEGSAVESADRWPTTLRSLRHRNFRIYFAGQLVSLIGTWTQSTAQAWLVYKLAGPRAGPLLGLIAFAGQIPMLVCGPFGGTVADSWNRRRVVVATQTASMILAFTLAALVLTGHAKIWHIFIMAISLGIVNAFDIPARQSFLVELVGKSDLMNAIALNSSMFHGARIIGPAFAGLTLAVISEGWCFFLNGISFLAVIAGLLLVRVPPSERKKLEGSAVSRIGEGFRFVAATAPIRVLLMHLGLVSLLGMPYMVLMPIFADKILHGGARGYGLLMGASGVGALAGAILLANRSRIRGLGNWIAIGSICYAVALILFAFSRSFAVSAFLLVIVGLSMMLQMGGSNTLIQAMIPDSLRGRVMSVYSMMLMGMAPLGALLAGGLEARWGAPATVAAGGFACLLSACVYQFARPALRPVARKLIEEQLPEEATLGEAAG
jgi:MFS family permease